MADEFYKTLGVNKTASAEDIKKAYKTEAMKHHPDRGGNEATFKKLNEAYDTLKDSTKKANYDATGGAPGMGNMGGSPGGGFHYRTTTTNVHDINDIFGQAFKGQRVGGGFSVEDILNGFDNRQRRPVSNRDININYSITLEESFLGKETEIKAQTPDGQSRKIHLNIPAGIENGMRIRYAGEGTHQYKQLPPGDLYVMIRIIENDRFDRYNSDLRSFVEIDVLDAMAGTYILFENIDGNTIKIRIPEGTQPGQTLRVPGKGMPQWRAKNSGRGDLYLEIKINIPKMSTLNETAVDALQRARIIIDEASK